MGKSNSLLLSRHANISQDFLSKILSLQRLNKVALSLGIRTRKDCILRPALVLVMWLSCTCWALSGRSAVAHQNISRVKRKKRAIGASDAGFSKAKKLLPLSFILKVGDQILGMIEKQSMDKWQWKHGPVKVVDGTGVTIEDTRENLRKFSRQNNKGRESGFCVGRVLALFDLAHGGLINLELSNWKGKASGEASLLQLLWKDFKSGDTLLGDAGFCSYSIFCEATRRDIKVVVELRGRMQWRLSKKKKDQIIEIKKPYTKPKNISDSAWKKFPETISLRVITLECAPQGFRPRKKYIATTHLAAAEVPAQDIADLYRRRWQVELNLRSIKTSLGMELLTAKNPKMVEKQIWIYALTYNLIRLQMARIAKIYDRLPHETSFTATADAVGTAIFLRTLGGLDPSIVMQLEKMLAHFKVGNRNNRYEPRVLKRRKKNFAFLSEPRSSARLRLHKKRKT